LTVHRTEEAAVTSRLNPYLHFPDSARQALEFYREVFGGELALSTYGEGSGAEGPDADKIMHGQLETPAGYTLMASDAPEGMPHSAGSTISISLSGDDPELRGYFERLAAGGSVTMPLEKQVWGDEFGMCTDRFGVEWLVNLSQPTG
jgi:PhnB protein